MQLYFVHFDTQLQMWQIGPFFLLKKDIFKNIYVVLLFNYSFLLLMWLCGEYYLIPLSSALIYMAFSYISNLLLFFCNWFVNVL